MAEPKKPQPRTAPPPRAPGAVVVPRPRGAPVIPAKPPEPAIQERAVPPTPPVTPWPLPVGNPSSARSWQALAFLVAAALVLVVGLVLMVRPLVGQDDETTDPGQGAPTVPFDPPVVLPANGSYVETVVLPSGDLKVTHWIHSKVSLFSIKLAAPVLDGFEVDQVTAAGIEVVAGRRVVPGASAVDDVSQSYTFFGAKSIFITYVLSGAVEMSTSEAGRALARVTALDVTYASVAGTSVRRVEGAEVLNMACSPGNDPDAVPEPCGSPAQGGWQVELVGEDRGDRVMAQLDLS